jgi:hypothetical protein
MESRHGDRDRSDRNCLATASLPCQTSIDAKALARIARLAVILLITKLGESALRRRLERDCQRNIEAIRQAEQLAPDFKTHVHLGCSYQKVQKGTCRKKLSARLGQVQQCFRERFITRSLYLSRF